MRDSLGNKLAMHLIVLRKRQWLVSSRRWNSLSLPSRCWWL